MSAGQKSTSSSGIRAPFMAFCTDADSLQVLRQYAESNKWSANCIQQGNAETAASTLKNQPTPLVLLVEIPSAQEAPAMLDKLADVCDPSVKVIVSGKINEYSFYTWLLDIGIANYLLQPFSLPSLQALHTKISQPVSATVASDVKKEGQVISVIGTRGGVGSTTIAVNLSWILSHHHMQHVALLDLDPQIGTVAMALDLEPGRGLRDALEKPDRVDSLFMERVMVRYDDHLSILSAEEPLEEMIITNEAAAEAILRETKKKYSHVVIDVPRQMTAFTRHALKISDHVIVITETTVPGLRDALRLSDYCREVLKIKTPIFVANREGVAGKYHMSKAEFEKGLSQPLSHTIPFVLEAYASTNTGEVLVESHKNSSVIKVVHQMADRFVEGAEASQESKPAKGLLSLFKGGK